MAETDARRDRWGPLLASAVVGGALLFLSDHPVHAWPLQLVAFVPLLVALARFAVTRQAAAVAGLIFGLTYDGLLLRVLDFPPLLGGALVLILSLLWAIVALGQFSVLRWPAPLGGLAAGAVVAIVEWASATLVPVWGTAQCFARVWSVSPFAVQLAGVGGMAAIAFVVVAAQALAVQAVARPRGRRASTVATLVVLLLAVFAADALLWRRGTHSATAADPPLRVAALAWTEADVQARATDRDDDLFDKLYLPLLDDAVRAGARLVVSPEVGFVVPGGEHARLLDRLGVAARDRHVSLAVGYFDSDRQQNRIAFFDEHGTLRGAYVKTHLIYSLERYRRGDGTLVTMPLGDAGRRLGGMICQDDNFTDLARGYGRLGVDLVAVPTNDWRQVMQYHLENALFRAVENGYGIVRAASNGIAVIVSPRGEILARRDPFREGAGVIVAELPAGRRTLYSSVGDWATLPYLLLLAGGFVWVRQRSRGGSGNPRGTKGI